VSESAEFKFDDSNWQRFLKGLGSKINRIQYNKEFGGFVAVRFAQDYEAHFQEQKGPDGKWDAWSKAYAEHMRSIGKGSKKILEGNRGIYKGYKASNWRGVSAGVIVFNNAQTKDGFAYAKHHDEGRSSWMGNPRPFMWISNKAIDGIISDTLKWLKEG
jgi:hypothetical protein